MSHTAIGIFRERAQAEAAVHLLMDNGFRRDKMDIAFPDPKESRGDATDENGTLNSKVGRFFLEIFQGDGNQALKYAAVGQRGVIIAVQCEYYADARKAAQLLDQSGALDVEAEGRMLEDSMTRSDRTLQNKKAVEAEKRELEVSADAAAASAERPREIRYEERLNTGEHTIHSRIVERRAGGEIRSREEQTWIERNENSAVDDTTQQPLSDDESVKRD